MTTDEGLRRHLKAAIRVTDDRVLIKPDKAMAALSRGGILMPETARQEDAQRGTVIATGPGRLIRVLEGVNRHQEVVYNLGSTRVPMTVAVGDRVLVVMGRCLRVKHLGEECWIVSEPNVLAIEDGASALRPLQDRLLVERTNAEERSEGGIIIPTTAKDKPLEGTVLAAGAGRMQEDGTVRPVGTAVGDHVLFGGYTASSVRIDGADLLLVKDEDVLGIVKGEAT